MSRLGVAIVKQYERGVVFRLGKLRNVRDPGMRFMVPLVDHLMKVSLRTVTMPIPSQQIITQDNVSIGVAAVLLLGMATAHLANYPIHRWVWRAPLFVVMESAGEMLTSLLLLGIGREPYGTRRAELSDWPAMAAGTLLTRGVAVIVWALILAGVVMLVRRTIVMEEPEPEEAPKG